MLPEITYIERSGCRCRMLVWGAKAWFKHHGIKSLDEVRTTLKCGHCLVTARLRLVRSTD